MGPRYPSGGSANRFRSLFVHHILTAPEYRQDASGSDQLTTHFSKRLTGVGQTHLVTAVPKVLRTTNPKLCSGALIYIIILLSDHYFIQWTRGNQTQHETLGQLCPPISRMADLNWQKY
jgi:hypothetical protein